MTNQQHAFINIKKQIKKIDKEIVTLDKKIENCYNTLAAINKKPFFGIKAPEVKKYIQENETRRIELQKNKNKLLKQINKL